MPSFSQSRKKRKIKMKKILKIRKIVKHRLMSIPLIKRKKKKKCSFVIHLNFLFNLKTIAIEFMNSLRLVTFPLVLFTILIKNHNKKNFVEFSERIGKFFPLFVFLEFICKKCLKKIKLNEK